MFVFVVLFVNFCFVFNQEEQQFISNTETEMIELQEAPEFFFEEFDELQNWEMENFEEDYFINEDSYDFNDLNDFNDININNLDYNNFDSNDYQNIVNYVKK